MRYFGLSLALIIFITGSSVVIAVEPVSDQQLMLYYQIPFGGHAQNTKHKFGLRLDHTLHNPDEVVQINQLMKKPAVMDLQFKQGKPFSFKIHGVDYTRKLYVHHADETANGEAEAVEPVTESTDVEVTGETQPETVVEETKTGEETVAKEEEKSEFQKNLEEIPAGALLGLAIGVVLIFGLGG